MGIAVATNVLPLGFGGDLEKAIVGAGGVKVAPGKITGMMAKGLIHHMRGSKRHCPALAFDIASGLGDLASRRFTSTEIPHDVMMREMNNPPPTPSVAQETGKKVMATKLRGPTGVG